jgi:predicted nucleic acid-binding protein
MMEVLSGTRSKREARATRSFLARGPIFRFDAASDFERAAAIYAAARRRGITPNSHVAFMIIAVAARHELPLITLDSKQAAVAELFGVTVI